MKKSKQISLNVSKIINDVSSVVAKVKSNWQNAFFRNSYQLTLSTEYIIIDLLDPSVSALFIRSTYLYIRIIFGC